MKKISAWFSKILKKMKTQNFEKIEKIVFSKKQQTNFEFATSSRGSSSFYGRISIILAYKWFSPHRVGFSTFFLKNRTFSKKSKFEK